MVSLPVHAEDLAPKAWTQVIQELEDKGIKRVGDFNLSTFKDRVKDEVTWKTLTSESRPDFAEGRRSAFFIIEDKTVHMAAQLPAYTESSLPHLQLHEALGALDFKDKHYELSTALETLNLIKNPDDRQKMLEIYGKTIFKKENMRNGQGDSGGSGSGVGGGGDLIALSAKNQVLKAILTSGEKVLTDFLKTYPQIGFEPQYNPKEQFVSLKYVYAGPEVQGTAHELPNVLRDLRFGYQELITIYVPVKIWESGGSARKKLITEIKQRVLELFPAYRGTKMRTYERTACGQAVRFPVSTHLEVMVVQELRATVNQGCEALFPYYAVTAPKMDENFKMNAPKVLKYTCELAEGKDVYSRVEVIPELGAPHGEAYGTMISDYSVLLGHVYFNADGSLMGMSVFNSKNKKSSPLQEVRMQGFGGSVKTRGVSGKSVSFTCKGKRS